MVYLSHIDRFHEFQGDQSELPFLKGLREKVVEARDQYISEKIFQLLEDYNKFILDFHINYLCSEFNNIVSWSIQVDEQESYSPNIWLKLASQTFLDNLIILKQSHQLTREIIEHRLDVLSFSSKPYQAVLNFVFPPERINITNRSQLNHVLVNLLAENNIPVNIAALRQTNFLDGFELIKYLYVTSHSIFQGEYLEVLLKFPVMTAIDIDPEFALEIFSINIRKFLESRYDIQQFNQILNLLEEKIGIDKLYSFLAIISKNGSYDLIEQFVMAKAYDIIADKNKDNTQIRFILPIIPATKKLEFVSLIESWNVSDDFAILLELKSWSQETKPNETLVNSIINSDDPIKLILEYSNNGIKVPTATILYQIRLNSSKNYVSQLFPILFDKYLGNEIYNLLNTARFLNSDIIEEYRSHLARMNIPEIDLYLKYSLEIENGGIFAKRRARNNLNALLQEVRDK